MPNVCLNTLTVTGPKDEIDRFLQAAQGELAGEPLLFSLQSLFPIPAHLNTGRPVSTDEPGETWYSWCCENWGTKWDVLTAFLERRSDEEVCVEFDSAWNPPEAAFTKKIAPDFAALTFVLEFEEPNIGFAGMCQWQEGRLVQEETRPLQTA